MNTHVISHYPTVNAMTTGAASFTRIVTSDESIDAVIDRIKSCHIPGFLGVVAHPDEIESRMAKAKAI